MNNHTRIFTALLACASSLPAFAAVTASIDKDHVALGDTVQLLVQIDGGTNSQPDLNALKRDFDVLNVSRSSSMQFINGTSSSQTQLNLVLAPKHEGTLQIPAIQWDKQQSPALTVTVGGNGANDTNHQNSDESADSAHVFLTTRIDQQHPFVQTALVLTARLYADVSLSQASLELPGNSDVIVKQFGKDSQTSETRNGHNYQVIERKYLLLPQKSGQISLKGPLLDAQVQDTSRSSPFDNDPFFGNAFRHTPLANMMGPTRPLHLYAKSIDLNVQPRPATVSDANWLPAKDVKLEETWKPDNAVNATIHTGEPISRHLHLTALGLTGAQLPDLSALMPMPDGIKAYPDQAKIEDNPQGDSILGSRDQDIALVASRPGRYDIPAVHLSWWDTTHDTQREVILPPHTFEVIASGNQDTSTAATPPDNATASSSAKTENQLPAQTSKINFSSVPPWQWVSLALCVLWLGTIFAWWRSRKSNTSALPQEKTGKEKSQDEHKRKHGIIRGDAAFTAFQRACRDNDPHAARRHLLEWAAMHWPENPPRGLNALADLLANAELNDSLRQLDRACYTGNAWQGGSLAQSITLPDMPSRSTERKSTIPELYPEAGKR